MSLLSVKQAPHLEDVQDRLFLQFTHRVVDGLIAETWRNADDLGRLLQLGATITPPPAR